MIKITTRQGLIAIGLGLVLATATLPLVGSSLEMIYFRVFGMQFVMFLVTNGLSSSLRHPAYWILSVIQFSVLAWAFIWVVNRYSQRREWLRLACGTFAIGAVSVAIGFAAEFVFWHFFFMRPVEVHRIPSASTSASERPSTGK